MNSEIVDLLIYVGMGAAVVAGFVIFAIVKGRQQGQDLYSFNLEGWAVIEDETLLYRVSQLFQEGLVAQALQMTGYSVGDYHSNLKKTGSSEVITGFIELKRYRSAMVVGPGAGVVLDDEKSFRYCIAPLARPQNYLTVFNSGNLASAAEKLKELGVAKAFKDSLREFEKLYPLNTWQVIIHGTQLVVLVPEIFDRPQLLRFLAQAESLQSQLG